MSKKQTTPLAEKEFYTISEIANHLGVTIGAIHYYVRRKKVLIPTKKTGKSGNEQAFARANVESFLREYRKPDKLTSGEAAECLQSRFPLRQRSIAQWSVWLGNRIRLRKLPKPSPTAEFWNGVQDELDKEAYLFPEENGNA